MRAAVRALIRGQAPYRHRQQRHRGVTDMARMTVAAIMGPPVLRALSACARPCPFCSGRCAEARPMRKPYPVLWGLHQIRW